jgi:hypothetical protein
MAWDIYLTPELSDEPISVAEVGAYTWNVLAMYDKAGICLRSIHEKPAEECLSALDSAVRKMEADPETYRKLAPPTGWGTYEGALRYLVSLRNACRQHPKSWVVVI